MKPISSLEAIISKLEVWQERHGKLDQAHHAAAAKRMLLRLLNDLESKK